MIKDEVKESLCIKVVNDCYLGGNTEQETAGNYKRVIEKLAKANMKIMPEKTADILGWVWQEGGQLSASPHRKLALINTKIEDICKIRDMSNWIRLFKTLWLHPTFLKYWRH